MTSVRISEMDLNGAHSCEHCNKLVLDLAGGRFDSTVGTNRLIFNFNLHDLQQAYAQGCLLLSPIVSSWLGWNPSLFSQWEGQESDIVLFANIEYHFHEKDEDEHFDCDLTTIEGLCLWDTASRKQVRMPFAGEFYAITCKGVISVLSNPSLNLTGNLSRFMKLLFRARGASRQGFMDVPLT